MDWSQGILLEARASPRLHLQAQAWEQEPLESAQGWVFTMWPQVPKQPCSFLLSFWGVDKGW